MSRTTSLPPALVLGGSANALSIARSLAGLGVRVRGMGTAPFVGRSRFLETVPVRLGDDPEAALAEALLGPATAHLAGSVLLVGGDAGLTTVLDHRDALAERYVLDTGDLAGRRTLLDKLATYDAAREAGVPTPLYWRLDGLADLDRFRDELVFPLILKPLSSHRYQERFPDGTKFRSAGDVDELREQYTRLAEADIPVMLVQKIVEPDERLCSYYTYLDDSGTPTFDFTKRVIRRSPPGMGLGTYHITDRVPELKELSLRLFKHLGLRGLVVAEFIHDTSDGQYKLIEGTPRFTGATALVAAAGMDLARHVYLRAIGTPHRMPTSYESGRRLLYPADDFRSFLALRRAGRLTPAGWVRSIAHLQTFPFARWNDPMPAVARAAQRLPNLSASLRRDRG